MARLGGKQRIVDAAAALFGDRGYHATSMRDIADASGMLSGSLYAHIRGKEDLLDEIVRRAGEQFLSSIEPIADADLPPHEKLRAAMRAHVRVVASSLDDARVFLLEWRALRSPRREEIQAMRDRYEERWTRILESFPGLDVKMARLLVLSAANSLYQWYDPSGPMTPDEVADRFTDLLLLGLMGGSAPGKIRERGASADVEGVRA